MSDELELVRSLHPHQTEQTSDETALLSRVRRALMTTIDAAGTVAGEQVLRSARTVLLIDWHADVPRSLAAAGYDVYSVYQVIHRAELAREAPVELKDGAEVLEPLDPSDHRGVLVWHPVESLPDQIDVVCTYRPAAEQLELVERFALPHRARAFWVEEGGFASGMAPPYRGPEQLLEVSADARARCAESGIAVVEGLSIAAAARQVTRPTARPIDVAISPTLAYRNAHAGIRWLQTILGFELSALYEAPEGTVHYAQLVWSGGTINLHTADQEPGPLAGWGRASTVLQTASRTDVDRLFERASSAGADIRRPAEESFYGSYGFTVADPEGHLWTVGTVWLDSDAARSLPERRT